MIRGRFVTGEKSGTRHFYPAIPGYRATFVHDGTDSTMEASPFCSGRLTLMYQLGDQDFMLSDLTLGAKRGDCASCLGHAILHARGEGGR